MDLFSEIYSCYYQVLRHLLSSHGALTIQDIRSRICREGFEESLLSIIPKSKAEPGIYSKRTAGSIFPSSALPF